MIPRVIHYVWFGGKPLTPLAHKCFDSWQKHCPDYQIVRWDETNYDVTSHPFIRAAYETKMWAFSADYARLDIIQREGGIYLDTDVELLTSLDPFLEENCFFGLETTGFVNTGLGFGARKDSPIIKENLAAYDALTDVDFTDGKSLPHISCPHITSEVLARHGWSPSPQIDRYGDFTVYPPEFFCPLDYNSKTMTCTDSTVSIHHFGESWVGRLSLLDRLKSARRRILFEHGIKKAM